MSFDAAVARMDHASRDVLLGMSGLLSKIEDDLTASKDRLARYAKETGDQAYPESLKLETVILGGDIAQARTPLFERLKALQATLQQERDAALAGASRAQPSRSKGKGSKGKGKAKAK